MTVPKGSCMSKTAFLQIRLTPEDHARIKRAAAAEHFDASTWARAVILRALERLEKERRKRLL